MRSAIILIALALLAGPAIARDLTQYDVRRAWQQASYRAQIRAAHAYYAPRVTRPARRRASARW